MRALLSTLVGFLLIALWSVALVAHQGGWLAWADAGAGILAVVAAFGFVRDRQSAKRLMAINGAALLFLSFLAVVFGGVRWLNWTSFALACGAILIALAGRSPS